MINAFSDRPHTVPLGVPFADRVSVRDIPRRVCREMVRRHHSYIPQERHNAIARHGIYLDDALVGTISYAYMLCSSEINGVPSDETIEVARVALSVDMSNLASCAMAKSQREFAANHKDIRQLTTYVHEDWRGSMFAALDSWSCDGEASSGQAGNRRDRDIRDVDKIRWSCELSSVRPS